MLTIKRKEEVLFQEETDFVKITDSIDKAFEEFSKQKIKSVFMEFHEDSVDMGCSSGDLFPIDSETVKALTIELY